MTPKKYGLTAKQEKKLEKAKSAIGKDTLKELEALSHAELKERIAQATQATADAKQELEANPKYIDLKEDLSALSQGMKDVKKRQDQIITVALHLLEQ